MSKRYTISAFAALAAWSIAYAPVDSNRWSVAGDLSIGASAQADIQWKPNPDRGSASRTLSGGRRGLTAECALDENVPDPALTLMVPSRDDVGLTTKAQPTLSWFIESETTTNMRFELFNPQSVEPLYTKTISAEAGLVEVTLPDAVSLEEGVKYRWVVFAECNDGRSQIHARSFVKRVATEDVALSDAMSLSEQAYSYASQGIWYDALDTLVSAYREQTQMSTLMDIRELLEQADMEIPLELSLATAAQS